MLSVIGLGFGILIIIWALDFESIINRTVSLGEWFIKRADEIEDKEEDEDSTKKRALEVIEEGGIKGTIMQLVISIAKVVGYVLGNGVTLLLGVGCFTIKVLANVHMVLRILVPVEDEGGEE